MSRIVSSFGGSTLVVASLLASAAIRAETWQVTGFLREEIAGQVDAPTNPANQQGNLYNGVSVPNRGLGPFLAPGLSPAVLTRPASSTDHNTWNQFATRLELNVDGKLTDTWAAHFKLRGFGDAVGLVDNSFKDVDLFRQAFRGSGSGTPLEVARQRWMLDLPAAYLDYNHGPFWMRIGNQQIAWGNAIFFRVLDVPDGLDLRRHSILDVAAEEFSDKRVPAPAVRASYRLPHDWTVEGFVQRFNPSILPAPDSPYNTIPSQFAIDQGPGYDAVKNEPEFGIRLQGRIADVDLQFVANHRRNPDGVFRWTDSSAGLLSGTPFQAGTGRGVYSAAEWFSYAASARLDGVAGLASALNEFPATLGLGSGAVAAGCGASVSAAQRISFPNAASAACVLDTFFDPVVGLGNLVGHLARVYPTENIFGMGATYVFEGTPDTFLDQLIGRLEVSYTPHKKFTNPSLSSDFEQADEKQIALIFEKNYKLSSSIPATYVVAQWLHKTNSDLFGRWLGGMGGSGAPGSPPGLNRFDAMTLALQQPSRTLAWRTDFTMLTDLHGGWLLQPGAKWHPSKSYQVDAYANIILTNGGNNDFGQTLKSAREIFVRGTYYF
jgi:hypothetical protein